MNLFAVIVVLIVVRTAVQLLLEALNRRHVLQHAKAVPDAFKDSVDTATYSRSIQYTFAKSRLHQVQIIGDALVLLVVLFSGVLPWSYGWFVSHFGGSVWSMALFLFVVGLGLAVVGLPFDWYAQFRLEERFGFNASTQKLWWLDRGKGLLLAFGLGYPLLVLVLKLFEWAGARWWFWAWMAVAGFQLVMAVLAPVIILPLFNKFTPLPPGSLRKRLLALATQTGFQVRSIEVMDGSKRSRHSNAFFTGFGRFRKIVLFDTLIQQLGEEELAAVLAHEIGHFKKRHIAKMLGWSCAALLAIFYLLSVLIGQEWFYEPFGFYPGHPATALLLFGLLSGLVTFWLAPLANLWSRRHEYQADAYAAEVMGESISLITALRRLSDKNLSNLTPHPAYSRFYYSHPAPLEREHALRGRVPVLPVSTHAQRTS